MKDFQIGEYRVSGLEMREHPEDTVSAILSKWGRDIAIQLFDDWVGLMETSLPPVGASQAWGIFREQQQRIARKLGVRAIHGNPWGRPIE